MLGMEKGRGGEVAMPYGYHGKVLLVDLSHYRARGWTAEGLIPEARLRELGLWELVGPEVLGRSRAGEPVASAPARARDA